MTAVEERLPSLYDRRSILGAAGDELRAVARYRRLVHMLISSSLRTENVSTVFGYLWWLLDPLFMMGAYVLLIDVIFRSGVRDFPLYVLMSITAWKYFAAGARDAMALTLSKERQMRQVTFPKLVLPLAAVLAESIRFAVALTIVLCIAVGFGHLPHWTFVALPLVGAVQFVFTLAVAIFLSALYMFFRDTQHVMTYLFQAWFFLSPALYAVSAVPHALEPVMRINPFGTILPAYHGIVLHHAAPDFAALGGVVAASTVLLAGAILFFVWVEPAFVKVHS